MTKEIANISNNKLIEEKMELLNKVNSDV